MLSRSLPRDTRLRGPRHRGLRLWDILLAILTILLTAGLVIIYVNREHFFYYYDYAGFEAVTTDLANTFRLDSLAAWKLIKNSIDLDYNYLFSLPVIPFIQQLGEQRLVYELGIALVYQVPYLFALGAIATRLFPQVRRPSFWVTVFLAILVPVVWAPMLRGYPDIGGAFLIAFMLFLFLYDDTLKQDWQVIVIGLFSALAVIFRRHFAYPVLSFYLAAFIYFIISALALNRGQAKAESGGPGPPDSGVDPFYRGRFGVFFYQCLRLATAAMVSLLTMLFLARPLLERMVTVDFNALYASYQVGLMLLLNYYSGLYGWLLLISAGIGIAIALTQRLVKATALLFVTLFSGISLLSWILVSRQIGFHYSLHLSILVVLGLSGLVLGVWRINRPALRWGVLLSLIMLLGVNFVFTLFVPSPFSGRLGEGWKKTLSSSFPPLTNPDYERVKSLVAFLRNTGGPDSQVYVVDSSQNMNSDMLRLAEQKLYGRQDIYLEVLYVPIIDSRDAYPLEELMRADFVVVSTPPQVHLQPQNQKIVLSMHDAFLDGWEIAQDFRKLDFQLVFKDGSQLSVYQRIRPTSWQTAVRALHAFSQYIGFRPGSQPDWIYLGTQYTGVTRAPGGKNVVLLKPGSVVEPMEGAFLWAEPLSTGGIVSGKVFFGVMPCGELSATIISSDASGRSIETHSQILTPEADTFSLPYAGEGAENLLFFLDRLDHSPETAECSVLLRWFPPEQ